MSFFGWVILIDVIAIVTIATLIFRLSTSRPADQNRAEMAEVVHEVLHTARDLGGFRPRRTRTTPSASGEASSRGLTGTIRTSLQGVVQSTHVVVSRFARDRSAETET